MWSRFSTTSIVHGPYSDQSVRVSQLRYSAEAANFGLDLSQWPALHRVLSTEISAANKFSMMSWLSAIAASDEAEMKLLQILALFFTANELRDVQLPSIQSCHPPEGYEVTSTLLKNTVRSSLVPLVCSPEWLLPQRDGESWRSYENRRNCQYHNNQNSAVRNLVAHLGSQWPTETPSVGQTSSDYVKVEDVEFAAIEQFKAYFDNLRFFQYLQRMETTLSRFSHDRLTFCQPAQVALTPLSRARPFVSAQDLFASPPPTLPESPRPLEFVSSSDVYKQPTVHLEGLINALKGTASHSRYEVSYIEDLHTSMRSLQEQDGARYSDLRNNYPIDDLRQHLDCLQRYCRESEDCLQRHVASAAGVAKRGIVESGHGPRLSPLLFLQQLSSGAWASLSPGWRSCVARYGLALIIENFVMWWVI
ncbi:hypothetical protein F4821DRAFT_54993 [Hypoxylon rubiginosum]|uniref:Uncharacterized protein n=1 Tax=Hypoxylon rubiginosum TaxID=110542 RepID=A0ACC0CJM5_9PEZI|nr:hypothetical protein F4821DRAFT_54993 [Hypoxylon rubiginosum]